MYLIWNVRVCKHCKTFSTYSKVSKQVSFQGYAGNRFDIPLLVAADNHA